MNTKKIKQKNGDKFLIDLKKVSEIMVYMPNSNAFLKVAKREVLKEAENETIDYYLPDTIFTQKRMSMVIR